MSRYDQAVEDAVLLVRPGILVLTDPVDWAMVERWADAFESFNIYRPVVDGAQADNGQVEPDVLIDFTLRVVDLNPWVIEAVQGYNEVITSNNVATQGPRELAFVRRMQAAGVPIVALNPGVGHIESEQCWELYHVFEEAKFWGYHGYLRPNAQTLSLADETYHLRRPDLMWYPGHPWVDMARGILTETGTYYDPPKTGVGWEDYARLLIEIHEYALSRGMFGTAAFTLAGYEPWQTQQPWQLVEHPEALAILAEYNRTHDGDAPPPEEETMAEDMTLGAGIEAKALELGGSAVTGQQLTGEIYLKDGTGKDTYSYAVFEKCEIRYYPVINRVFAVPFL